MCGVLPPCLQLCPSSTAAHALMYGTLPPLLFALFFFFFFFVLVLCLCFFFFVFFFLVVFVFVCVCVCDIVCVCKVEAIVVSRWLGLL